MGKIKILVPTDFSECAYNALNYALKLSLVIDGEIILMHSIQYKESSFIPPQSNEDENKEIYNKAKKNLDSSLKYAQSQNLNINVKQVLDAGPAERSIASVFDSEKIDYIVMGTEGASGLKAVISGSFTSNVLLIAPCPVFTIPLTAKFTEIKTVICATELLDSENDAIILTIEFAKIFNAEITFYNVNTDKKEQQILFKKFKERLLKTTEYSKIKFELMESNDIASSINKFAHDLNADLLVTLGKERDFMDNLFRKKITKKLCMNTTVPLLAFPHIKTSKN